MSKVDKLMSCVKTNGLTIETMGGVIGGVIFGLILRDCKETWSKTEACMSHMLERSS